MHRVRGLIVVGPDRFLRKQTAEADPTRRWPPSWRRWARDRSAVWRSRGRSSIG